MTPDGDGLRERQPPGERSGLQIDLQQGTIDGRQIDLSLQQQRLAGDAHVEWLPPNQSSQISMNPEEFVPVRVKADQAGAGVILHRKEWRIGTDNPSPDREPRDCINPIQAVFSEGPDHLIHRHAIRLDPCMKGNRAWSGESDSGSAVSAAEFSDSALTSDFFQIQRILVSRPLIVFSLA